jgi:DNA-binding NarL/FixJ family response regulator
LEDEPDILVVGEASNAAECLRKVQELKPDVVIADACDFESSAHDLERRVAREFPQARTVFLGSSDHADARSGLPTTENRNSLGQTSAADLMEMVRSSFYRGESQLQQAASANIRRRQVETRFPHERALTAREREVLKLLAEGNTVRTAATILGVSIKTVDAHKFNLMRKLHIHNKAELVMWAIQRKVVKVPVNF